MPRRIIIIIIIIIIILHRPRPTNRQRPIFQLPRQIRPTSPRRRRFFLSQFRRFRVHFRLCFRQTVILCFHIFRICFRTFYSGFTFRFCFLRRFCPCLIFLFLYSRRFCSCSVFLFLCGRFLNPCLCGRFLCPPVVRLTP